MWFLSLAGNALVEQKTSLSLGQQAVSLRDSHDRLKALRRVTSTAQILLAYSMVMRALSQTASRYSTFNSNMPLLVHFPHPFTAVSGVLIYLPPQCVSVQPLQRIRVLGSGRYPHLGAPDDSSSRGQGTYLCGQTGRWEGAGVRTQQLHLPQLPYLSHRQRGVSQLYCLQTASGDMHSGQFSLLNQLFINTIC